MKALSSSVFAIRPVLAVAVSCMTRDALALDKQGSAHGGAIDPDADGFNISGALMIGVAPANRTYAARPDNTGIALLRYAAHADIDVLGPKLSFPIDVNFFSDRERNGGGKLLPTELDIIAGVTTSHQAGFGAIELGTRVEHDRPIDRGGFTQTYIDARARYLFSLADAFPSLRRDLLDGDISGAFTLGWFAYNPTYAARPDNSGIALFRYAAHVELSVWHDRFSLGADFTFFTDRQVRPLAPSELDFTYEAIVHLHPFELHLAYERDMPLDQGGLVQSFFYGLLVYNFDMRGGTMPLETRGEISKP